MKIKITLIILLMSLMAGCAVTPKKSAPMVIKVPTDYGIHLTSFADVSKETVNYNYNINNITPEMRVLKVSHVALEGKVQTLDIDAKKAKQLKLSDTLKKHQLSPNTFMISLKPYLTTPTRKQGVYRPMLSNYDVDLKIKMPENARVLKSTVPFKKLPGNILQWKMKDIAILPPVDVWYTVSPDQIDVTTQVDEQGARALIKIEVKNKTSGAIGNVLLKTRIPSILYQVVQDESDGEFILQQDVMYIWNGKIDSLAANQSRTLNIVLEKINPRLPLKRLEIRAYNNQNELIELAQTIQAAPFFNE